MEDVYEGDAAISGVTLEDFDAFVLPGGTINAGRLRTAGGGRGPLSYGHD